MSHIIVVKLSLSVARVGGEPEAWGCSRHSFKPEGTCASSWVGVCVSLIPFGVPVMLDVEEDFVASL